jgi:hypothetical protein
MKNVSLLSLITAWMLFLSNIAVAADSLQSRKPHLHGSYEINHITFSTSNQSNFVLIQDGLSPQTNSDSVHAGFYDSRPKVKEANIMSVIPYWFYVLKIVILIVVLFWDDSDKAKSMRKSARRK